MYREGDTVARGESFPEQSSGDLLRISTSLPHPVGGTSKRLVDVVLVLAGAPFLLPILLVLALLIRASGPGSILFGHRRIGYAGEEFRCWKFRTMIENGDEVLADYFRLNPDEERNWRENRKLARDPRVTRIGAVLRRLSLDELPQFLNVLNGEMSLVGPRPIVRDELEYYGEFAAHYLKVRPGVTGLWQVSGRSDTSYAERVRLDMTYVESWSLGLDLRTLMKTVPAVLRCRGAV